MNCPPNFNTEVPYTWLLTVLRAQYLKKTKSFLELAWRNSEQLATIVNDILDIERLESGKK